MAGKVNREHQLKLDVMKHLSLRRKGAVVQLIWTEINGEDTWTTVFSEVSVRDIASQQVGNIYNGRK